MCGIENKGCRSLLGDKNAVIFEHIFIPSICITASAEEIQNLYCMKALNGRFKLYKKHFLWCACLRGKCAPENGVAAVR